MGDKIDIVARIKQLTAQLQDSLHNCTRTAAQSILIGNVIDSGGMKPVDGQNPPRFDKQIEDFFALCDQIEHHLRTSIECTQQGVNSARYLPYPVQATRVEPGLVPEGNAISYPQLISLARNQITYLKEVHDLLSDSVNPP